MFIFFNKKGTRLLNVTIVILPCFSCRHFVIHSIIYGMCVCFSTKNHGMLICRAEAKPKITDASNTNSEMADSTDYFY